MRKNGSVTQANVELNMTPMIDVVFQLLIFFLVTMKPIDIIGRLDVSRPQHDLSTVQEDPALRIRVLADSRYQLNERPMGLVTLEKNLRGAVARSRRQTVLVSCAEGSSHGGLIAALDLCPKVGLTNVAVATLPPAQ